MHLLLFFIFVKTNKFTMETGADKTAENFIGIGEGTGNLSFFPCDGTLIPCLEQHGFSSARMGGTNHPSGLFGPGSRAFASGSTVSYTCCRIS